MGCCASQSGTSVGAFTKYQTACTRMSLKGRRASFISLFMVEYLCSFSLRNCEAVCVVSMRTTMQPHIVGCISSWLSPKHLVIHLLVHMALSLAIVSLTGLIGGALANSLDRANNTLTMKLSAASIQTGTSAGVIRSRHAPRTWSQTGSVGIFRAASIAT